MQMLAEVERRERFLAGLRELRACKRVGIDRAARYIFYHGWRAGYLDGVRRSAEIIRDERRENAEAEA